MDERDLTQLSYLAHALVRSPTRFDHLAQRVSKLPQSEEFKTALSTLRDVCKQQQESTRPANWRPVVESLLRENDSLRQQVGRAVAWALENAG